LAIHLSVRNLRQIERDLTPFYGAECPVIIAYRVGWSDEAYIHTDLAHMHKAAQAQKITRTALIFVGKSLDQDIDFRDSALYDADHVHVLRPKKDYAKQK
jgi:precorrin-4/cobalt-precorrin-4 C11-methyltransferase